MSEVIMSVQEIINSALGDESKNTVNFRLLKAVLLILANQLRILQRHVSVNLSKRNTGITPRLTVSEVKIYSDNKKKKHLRASKDDPAACLPEGAIICKSTMDIEELRERELRIIEQRADSYEDPARTPSPMASAPSSKERLLIVGPEGPTPRLSIVTQEQFDKLVAVVHELQDRFNPVGVAGFPENVEFMKALRQGASLTEAMAALQLSARLEALEKTFAIMLSLLTILARNTPGVDLAQFKSLARDFGVQEEQSEIEVIHPETASEKGLEDEEPKDCVTYEELDNAMVELQTEVLKSVKNMTTNTEADASKNKKIITELERQLSMSQNFGDRFEQLETRVADYSEKVIAIDTGLSSQITSIQDTLGQMQYDLETGLDNLTEALANASTDPEVIAELHRRLAALQEELEIASIKEKESKAFQNDMALDLAELWKQIEIIREAKSDRDEVADALRDKAGIGALNGMVSLEQFHAVHGDLVKKIHSAYDKFNNQEFVWQKIIDDLVETINDKSDWAQVYTLRDDISKHLNGLRAKIDTLLEIVGEPRAAATSKLLFRNTECLSCRVPARMELETSMLPLLPAVRRATADGAEAINRPGEHGDHMICIQEQPIPHPRDPRSHVCQRYCGGSHTIIPTAPRTPLGITITPLPREVSTSVGTDGKSYMTEEQKVKTPCLACNMPKTLEPIEGEVAPKPKRMSKVDSFDMLSCMDWLPAGKSNSGSMSPLPSND